MKKLLFTGLLSFLFLAAQSQKIHFVYLQTEQEQPFFVRMNEKIYSSTASGYLILSRLLDSVYQVSIGFPDNTWPEQRFSLAINHRDYGYLLKYFEGKGWGLYNLQTLAVQMATVSNAGTSTGTTVVKDESKFTDILSKAADDPSLKEKVVPVLMEVKKTEPQVQTAIVKEEVKSTLPDTKKEEPVKTTPTETVNAKKEEPKITPAEPVVTTKKEEPPKVETLPVVEKPKSEETYKPSVVKKITELATSDGISITFIDQQEGKTDTIRVLVVADKPVVEPAKTETKEEKRFLELSDTARNAKIIEEKPVETVKQAETSVVKPPAVKNNCSATASESDFFKLRKKMAGETSDYDMVDEARKVFKTRCFSVAQVKNLSALFLSDLGKYMFFDAFYSFVSDPVNYPSLESELKDPYYIARFKAMLRN